VSAILLVLPVYFPGYDYLGLYAYHHPVEAGQASRNLPGDKWLDLRTYFVTSLMLEIMVIIFE
jgi:hypothetical protein